MRTAYVVTPDAANHRWRGILRAGLPVAEFPTVKRMMRSVVLTVGVLLVSAGCMSHRFSEKQISENFLNGVRCSELTKIDYWYRGNHAGHNAAFRIKASPEVFGRVLKGAKHLGMMSPANAEERPPEAHELHGAAPEWYRLDQAGQYETYYQTGENGFTSSFFHFYYLDAKTGDLYLHASGI